MSLSEGTDFLGLLDNGDNNGAMEDNVDNVENESGFGRLGTIATVRWRDHLQDNDDDDGYDDIYIMVKCMSVCDVFAYFCV